MPCAWRKPSHAPALGAASWYRRRAEGYLYLFLDIWSRRIVGAEVHDTQQSEVATRLLRRICVENDIDTGNLVVHSDNGAPMKGSTMLATMQSLGITPSFSRPSVSDDNAFAESLFRHLKYAPSYPRGGFSNLEEARVWVARFVGWYNHQHLHSSIGLVTSTRLGAPCHCHSQPPAPRPHHVSLIRGLATTTLTNPATV